MQNHVADITRQSDQTTQKTPRQGNVKPFSPAS